MGRIHEIAQPVLARGIADKLLHQLGLRQLQAFDRVRRQEAVLDVKERSLRLLRRAPRDQRQVRRLLGVAGKEHSPAAVGHPHDVIMAGVDIERLRGQGARADVKDHRQALARDHVQDLLHQDQSLPGGKIGHPAAGERESLASAGGTVLRLGLQKSQRLAPEIAPAVGHRHLIAAAHVRRRRDRISAGPLADVALDPDHRLGAVGRAGNAGKGDHNERREQELCHGIFPDFIATRGGLSQDWED